MVSRGSKVFLLLVLLIVAGGCGSSQSFAPVGGAPAPSVAGTGTVVVEQQLLSRAIPAAVAQQRFLGFDSSQALVYGPTTVDKAATITLSDVPVSVTRIQMQLLDVNGQVLGLGTFDVTIPSGGMVTIVDPDFSDIAQSLSALSISPTDATLAAGSSRQLKVEATFSDGSTQDVTSLAGFTADSDKVSVQDSDDENPGLVTASQTSTGTTTVTASFGNRSAQASITVTDKLLESINIQPSVPSVIQRATLQLKATGQYSDGSSEDLTSQVQWISQDPDVATVSSGGVLTGAVNSEVSSAQTDITATLQAETAQVTVTVVKGSGPAYSWGSNTFGQLGDGTNVNKNTPVAVEQGAVPPGVTFTAIAVGDSHSLALGSDGKLYAWGDNFAGQLGDGTTVDKNTPVAVERGELPEGQPTTLFAAEGFHTILLSIP